MEIHHELNSYTGNGEHLPATYEGFTIPSILSKTVRTWIAISTSIGETEKPTSRNDSALWQASSHL